MKLLIAFASLVFTFAAGAAPFPATSSSVLTDPAKGVFFHGFGFRLKIAGTEWVPVPSTGDSIFETLRFEPKNGLAAEGASLSIRMDRLKEVTPLETYARKWMRDYPSYGFEVLGAKSFQLSGGRGLVVDMLQRNKKRQLRQVILQKDLQIAVLTCFDQKEHFQETLLTCNQIIRSFEWSATLPVSPAPATSAPPAPKAAMGTASLPTVRR